MENELELRAINILLSNKVEHVFRRVWALTDGVIAIHRSVNSHRIFRRWQITHLETGMAIGGDLHRHEINTRLAKVRELLSTVVGGVAFDSLPACEAILLAPLCAMQSNTSYRGLRMGEGWRGYAEAALDAHSCQEPQP